MSMKDKTKKEEISDNSLEAELKKRELEEKRKQKTKMDKAADMVKGGLKTIEKL